MKSSIVEKKGLAGRAGIIGKRRERLFYMAMAAAAVITVFAGFARTYYLKLYFGTPSLTPLLHLHGM